MAPATSTSGYADLIRNLSAQSRRHRLAGYLGLVAILVAAGVWAVATEQRTLLVVGLFATAAAVGAWLVVHWLHLGRRAVERFVEHPDQVVSIDQLHRSRAVFLQLRLGTGETLELKVPARQASAIGRQLKASCRMAALHVP